MFDAGNGGGNHHESLLMPTTTFAPLRHDPSGRFGRAGPAPAEHAGVLPHALPPASVNVFHTQLLPAAE